MSPLVALLSRKAIGTLLILPQLPIGRSNPPDLPVHRIHLPGVMVVRSCHRLDRRTGSLYHGRRRIQGQVER